MEEEAWRFTRRKLCRMVVFVVVVSLFPSCLKHSLCSVPKSEGLALLRLRERVVRDPLVALSSWNGDDGVIDPCLWFGVVCSDGKVVALNLKDLCLQGTLAPEIGKLAHIKSIILRNNSFFGELPKEILQLEELELLDLGFNNFSGPLPSELGSNPSLKTLLLDNNEYLANLTPERYNLKMISEFQVNDEQTGATTREACVSRSSLWNIGQRGDIAYRMQLLQVANPTNTHRNKRYGSKETVSPSRFPSSLSPNSEPFSPSPSTFSPTKGLSTLPAASAPLSHSPSPSPSPSPFSPKESPSNSPSATAPLSNSRSPFRSPKVSPSPSPSSKFFSPSPSPSPTVAPTPHTSLPANPPTIVSTSPESNWVSAPSPPPFTNQWNTNSSNPMHHSMIIWSTVGGFSLLILVSATALACSRSSKVVSVKVKPWLTGLSDQLQKAFVTGVPNLKRTELEAACEDFSNIVGSLPDGTAYKGTLSTGVEIAVACSSVTISQNWSKNMEAQFRKKIATLSRVNHKNFVNLIGYCEENKPFTRMMVFEYAPNGTLFEHLHIRGAEQLQWVMRKRIAMGIAYCLENMHELNPPIAHRNLQSSSICLTEDYAAKVSDLSFWNDIVAIRMGSEATQLLETPSASIKGNVYSFGVILFELVTGRIPYAVDNGFLTDWAAEYVREGKALRDVVDPSLKNSLQEDEIEKWSEVIKCCLHADPEKRPTMSEVTASLKEITAMGPDGANPNSSPLWWAEMEITSTDAS